MSTAASRFELQIRFVHVPDALIGMPLPAEVVSAGGTVQPVVLTVAENKPMLTPVSAPGRYLIRAELPSGCWVSQVAQVPDDAATTTALPVTATFDLNLPTLSGDRLAQARERGFQSLEENWKLYGGSFGALPPLPPDDVEFSEARLEFGWFKHWGEASAGHHVMVLRSDAAARRQCIVPGHVTLPAHPSWKSYRPAVCPFYVLCRISNTEADRGQALFLWPPGESDKPLQLAIDPKYHNPDAPPLMAAATTGDPLVDALFAYISTGAVASARQAAQPLVAKAEQFLREKMEEPVRACLAAYTLLRVGAIKQPQWVANLANWFSHLPDGEVVYGWYLLRNGDSAAARDHFHRALAKGVPMYSEGLRLLRDGLNFVSGLVPKDTDVKSDAIRVNALASVANLESKLTCLRLGKRLQVEWSRSP